MFDFSISDSKPPPKEIPKRSPEKDSKFLSIFCLKKKVEM